MEKLGAKDKILVYLWVIFTDLIAKALSNKRILNFIMGRLDFKEKK